MTTGFGSRVIGEEQFAREQEAIASGANIYGERVVGDRATNPDRPAAAGSKGEVAPPVSQTTPTFLDGIEHGLERKLAKIREIATLDHLYEDEMAGANRTVVLEGIEARRQEIQSEGALSVDALRQALKEAPEFLDEAILREFNRPQIRKGAVRLFIELETSRGGGPRADVLERLEGTLG